MYSITAKIKKVNIFLNYHILRNIKGILIFYRLYNINKTKNNLKNY